MRISFHHILIAGGLTWMLLLFVTSINKPPFLNSDPAHGFLDLMHYRQGGKFQCHFTADPKAVTGCIEERTTWWSPGQWYFVYLLMNTGMPLGIAISTLVFLAALLGWIGWMKLYRHFGFDPVVVSVAGLLILSSRYLYASFQIFPGASILELASTSWFILLWTWLNKQSRWLHFTAILLLVPISFFIKSSMLILWLCLIASLLISVERRSIPWSRVFLLSISFFGGKYVTDILFIQNGATPFSISGGWFGFAVENISLFVNHILFIIQGPFLATLGLEDYIKYIFQKPDRVIFSDGHPAILFIYIVLQFLFSLLLVHFFKSANRLSKEYSGILTAFLALFILFFLYAYATTRPISGYDDSRHYRIAGLLLLPIGVRALYDLAGRYLFVFPIVFFAYAIPSHFSKLNRERAIIPSLRIPRPILKEQDHQLFLKMAATADFVYVTSPEMKYELDPCKSWYQLDDFTKLKDIAARSDQKLSQKVVLFVLPDRFRNNGKEAAILGNFKPVEVVPAPEISETPLEGLRLITVKFH